jgi:hypothetical protein
MLKLYPFIMTLVGAWSIVAFRPLPQSQKFNEITARRILLIDSAATRWQCLAGGQVTPFQR